MSATGAPSLRHDARSSRSTVARRLLAGYVLVLLALALTVGWSVVGLRAAASDAELLRAGYVPLLLRIGEALAEQNVFNAQLNDVTAAKNPLAVREWIETSRRTRPFTFGQIRDAVDRGLGHSTDPEALALRADVLREASAIERSFPEANERYALLFRALASGDRDGSDRLRDELVKREADSALRLRAVKARVEEQMDKLTGLARSRELRSMQLLVGSALLAFVVGVATTLHARRVLAPLSQVTARANAVARGDLTPREVIATNDELGELATTFEGMVAAIERARAELVHAERLAAVGKMAAHVTHEIRNPLSAIGLNVDLLEEEIGPELIDREAGQLLQAIKAEVDRLSRIAEQYLSIARRPRPRLEVERVEDLALELVQFVRPELERANVAIVLEVGDGLPELWIDEAQLRQALVNLLRNAREAMPSGGEVALRVLRAVGGGVDLVVDDRGSGIADDARGSIFDPFFTTKARGTGLGLAITREIVEAHGGAIACEAREGGGTRFVVHLPERDAPAEQLSGQRAISVPERA
jgi:signal transduction histidine kinase